MNLVGSGVGAGSPNCGPLVGIGAEFFNPGSAGTAIGCAVDPELAEGACPELVERACLGFLGFLRVAMGDILIIDYYFGGRSPLSMVATQTWVSLIKTTKAISTRG